MTFSLSYNNWLFYQVFWTLFSLTLHNWTAIWLIRMVSALDQKAERMLGVFSIPGHEKCESYLVFSGEAAFGDSSRAFLYFLGLAYCFIGLSAITARFFRSMENVVKHTKEVEEIDPVTHAKTIRHEKVWNYTIADISLLAFGTSFPQISLATIDAIRNIGKLYAGGLWFKISFLMIEY